MKIKCLCFLCFFTLLNGSFAHGDGPLERRNILIDPKFRATKCVEEHFAMGEKAMSEKDWPAALKQFQIVMINFPYSCCYADAVYFSGVAYFHLGDYDLANRRFSLYLKEQSIPKYFEEVFCYKFAIAEHFRKGAGKHLFGVENFPKWLPASMEAVELYDEIATTLPNDELAPRAIYSKALLLKEMKDYKGSIEAIHTLIRRYPKNTLSAAGYLVVACDYYHLGRCEPNNPDLLALAIINIRRFGQDFPGDPRINEALRIFCEMEELYACGLYEMGQFYERICKPKASIIYYLKTVKEFPDTKIASLARARLNHLEGHGYYANQSFGQL